MPVCAGTVTRIVRGVGQRWESLHKYAVMFWSQCLVVPSGDEVGKCENYLFQNSENQNEWEKKLTADMLTSKLSGLLN